MFSSTEEEIKDYNQGKIIIVVDDENRENEGDMICNAKYATPENINYMAQNARGVFFAISPFLLISSPNCMVNFGSKGSSHLGFGHLVQFKSLFICFKFLLINSKFISF